MCDPEVIHFAGNALCVQGACAATNCLFGDSRLGTDKNLMERMYLVEF
jgi:hypothetical protein